MKSCLLGILGLALTTTACHAAIEFRPPAAQDAWLKDYAEARAAARLSGKPILVVFR